MLAFLSVIMLLGSLAEAGDFMVYAPSRNSEALLVVQAREKDGVLTLQQSKSIDLGFAGVAIT